MQARKEKTMKINTNKKRSIQGDWQKKGTKMEKKNYYSAIVLLTIVLTAASAFAFVDNGSISAPNAATQSSKSTISHSFADGNISCDGKTGWQIIAEQVANIL
jgi:hypothetical protein